MNACNFFIGFSIKTALRFIISKWYDIIDINDINFIWIHIPFCLRSSLVWFFVDRVLTRLFGKQKHVIFKLQVFRSIRTCTISDLVLIDRISPTLSLFLTDFFKISRPCPHRRCPYTSLYTKNTCNWLPCGSYDFSCQK